MTMDKELAGMVTGAAVLIGLLAYASLLGLRQICTIIYQLFF